MKYKIVLLLLVVTLFGCYRGLEKVENPVYHISVVPFGDVGFYCIHFTNDNWVTSEDIMICR